MPISQSACARHRAERYRLSYAAPSFRAANPSFIAVSSMLEIHSRRVGFLQPQKSYTSWKMSCPSRPASVAHTTASTSSRPMSARRTASCFSLSRSVANCQHSGTMGRSS